MFLLELVIWKLEIQMKVLAGKMWKTFIALIDNEIKDNFVLKLVIKKCDL